MRLKLTVLALLSIASLGASAQSPGSDGGLVFVSAHYTSRAQLQDIAARFQHVAIDRRTRTVRLEATHDEFMQLRRAGIDARIDDAATLRMQRADAALRQAMAGRRGVLAQEAAAFKPPVDSHAIAGFACYRTVEETYAAMDQMAQARPTLARVLDIGPSWLENRQPGAGHRMRVLRLTNSATDAIHADKPDMVVEASIHAREYTPAELLTRFAQSLVDGYGSDDEATWLLDNFRFHFVLQGNPDGREKAEAGLSWRKNVDDGNGTCSDTSYGVDLNRNFPYFWNRTPGGSSGNPCGSTYRGPRQQSETETQNLLRYIAGTPDANGVYRGGVFPDRRASTQSAAAPRDYRGMFIDLHSFSRTVLWPWSYTTGASGNAGALRTLARRLAWFNRYRPQQWVQMYAADGTSTDTIYGSLGVPSYTIEMGVAFFEDCSTFESTTLPRNLAALRYAARNLQAPYLAPSGPDTSAISVSPATVAAGTPVTVTATIDDSRFNQNNGAEPVQAIRGAGATLDRRPWEQLALPYAMQAVDGQFNAAREIVRVTIPTQGLGNGRHVVFVRGTDASGRAGTPNAAYFTVTGSGSASPMRASLRRAPR